MLASQKGLCSRGYLRDATDGDSGYVASDYSVWMNTGFKRCERKVSWPIRNYYLGVCQEAMRKSRRERNRCSPYRGWSSDHASAISVLNTCHIYLRFLSLCSEHRLLPSVFCFPAGRSWAHIPAGARDFLSSITVQIGYGPSQPPIQRVPVFFLGVKELGLEADNSLSGAGDRYGWSCTSASPMCVGKIMPCTFMFRICVAVIRDCRT